MVGVGISSEGRECSMVGTLGWEREGLGLEVWGSFASGAWG